jgi:uncharacterized membrane protein
VDALRGLAIVNMIAFHLGWDLDYLGVLRSLLYNRAWIWYGRCIATTFIVLLGVSAVLSYHRSREPRRFLKTLRRGAVLLGCGLAISLVTYLFMGSGYVVFGILHMLGVSTVVAYPFAPYRRRYLGLAAGLALIGAGLYANRQLSTSFWLLPLGVPQIGRAMADYYPVLPWTGVALIGTYVGHVLYPHGVRRFALPDGSGLPVLRQLAFLGRHSLLIYLVHQPLLMGALLLFGVGR